ncbi:MAG TPA: hypothetical protein VNA25_07870, partial [Phycisphaerae bacterium]|nr:hypothetical protein [Phycisphaerae bacterium]
DLRQVEGQVPGNVRRILRKVWNAIKRTWNTLFGTDHQIDTVQELIDRIESGEAARQGLESGEAFAVGPRFQPAAARSAKMPEKGLHGLKDASQSKAAVNYAKTFLKPETLIEGRGTVGLRGLRKVGRHVRSALTETLRPYTEAGVFGSGFEQFYKESRQKAGHVAGEAYRTWSRGMDALRPEMKIAVKARPEYKVELTRGGAFEDGKGGVRESVKMAPQELWDVAMQILASRAAPDDASLRHMLDRFVMGESAKGQAERVWHSTPADRQRILASLSNQERRIVEKMGQLHDDLYEAVDAEYFRHNKEHLARRDYYNMIRRDLSFTKGKIVKGTDGEPVDLAKAMQKQSLLVGLSPHGMAFTKETTVTQAPYMVGNLISKSIQHASDVHRYIEASMMKDWLLDNVLQNEELVTVANASVAGQEAVRYLADLEKKIAGTLDRGADEISGLIEGILDNATMVRLFSVWVAAKQEVSAVSGATYFGLKYLPYMFKSDRVLERQVIEASPYLYKRWNTSSFAVFGLDAVERGESDPLAGKMKTRHYVQKGLRKTLAFGDRRAILKLSRMAAAKVRDTQPQLKGQAFVNEVARQTDIAAQTTQVATEGMDRSLMQRNVKNPAQRIMVSYMWDARGAIWNQIIASWRKMYREQNASAFAGFSATILTAGIMNAAGIAAIDMVKRGYKAARDDDDDDKAETLSRKALQFGLATAENIIGVTPILGADLVPVIAGAIYASAGEKDEAHKRQARIGQGGVLSTPMRDINTLFRNSTYFTGLSERLANAKTERERSAIRLQAETRMVQLQRTMARVGSELSGLPVNQVIDMLPNEISEDPARG